jgi:hypothetical protein
MDRANLHFITTDHQRVDRIFMRLRGLEITPNRNAPIHADWIPY